MSISGLEMFPVADRGTPNSERIAFQASVDLQLAPFGLLVGLKLASGRAIPIYDNFFWFGAGKISQNDWLVVYTGAGTPYVDLEQKAPFKVFYFYWGRKLVAFGNPDYVPILFTMDSIKLGDPAFQVESDDAQNRLTGGGRR